MHHVLECGHAAVAKAVDLIYIDEHVGRHTAQASILLLQVEGVGEEDAELRGDQQFGKLALSPALHAADEYGARAIAIGAHASRYLSHHGDEPLAQPTEQLLIISHAAEKGFDMPCAVPLGQRLQVAAYGVVECGECATFNHRLHQIGLGEDDALAVQLHQYAVA